MFGEPIMKSYFKIKLTAILTREGKLYILLSVICTFNGTFYFPEGVVKKDSREINQNQ